MQLKNTGCSILLSTDASNALCDICYGYVMVDACDIIDKLDRMRVYLNDVHVIVHGSYDSSVVDANNETNNKLCNRFYGSD